MAEVFKKQSYEKFGVEGDFSKVLATGETLVLGSSVVIAEDKDGNDMSTTVLNQASLSVVGAKLVIQCKAGVATESPYKITFRTVTSANNQFEVDARMKVKEI